MRSVFINTRGEWRNGVWIIWFMLILFVQLLPLLLWSQQAGFEVSIAMQAALLLLTTAIVQLMRREPLLLVLGLNLHKRVAELGQGLLFGSLLMVLPAVVLMLIGAVSFHFVTLTSAISGLLMYLAVALAEELLFRGFVFQRLLAGLGAWPVQLIIAAFFVLTHMNNPGMNGSSKWLAMINIFIVSLIFGFAYLRTRSLLMPIALHFAANWVQGSLLGFGVSGNSNAGILQPDFHSNTIWLTGGQFGLEASVPGLIMVSVLCWWLLPKSAHRSAVNSAEPQS